MTYLYLFLVLLGLVLTLALGWRLASRRRSVPCPPWLGWFLENPLMEGIGMRALLECLSLEPGMKVLDVGCGLGRLTIPIAERVGLQGQVVALDIQPEMLRRAREKAKSANLSNIRFLQLGAGEGKLERNQYDRALLVTVLGEIPDRGAALKEIFDALKPGGVLSVSEVVPDPHFQSRGTVRRLGAAAGFRERACFGNGLAFIINLEKP